MPNLRFKSEDENLETDNFAANSLVPVLFLFVT
jgi:hypothetical protein